MSPCLCDKCQSCSGSDIILREVSGLITAPAQVAEVFITYYASIAEFESMPDGTDSFTLDNEIKKHTYRESAHLIRNRVTFINEFVLGVIPL